MGPCLGEADIERLAGGEPLGADAAEHVQGCVSCRERVEEAKHNSAFLTRYRSLAADTLGPEGSPRIAGYRVQGVLSSGAQGIVYRGVQESTSRPVAIKALSAGETASPRQRARAEREAEIAARLRHPNIVTVFESRTLGDGRIVVVMEFVDGVPLDAWRAVGMSAEERRRELLKVFIAVCNAIHHAHLNGVIHRDLKPDNILVTQEGRAVVLDFGIAKAGGIHTTMTGEFAGTPAYASPEQASGRADQVDALTDVYSLGVILYRLMCGALPYEVEGTIFEIVRTICNEPPRPPRECDPAMPADLAAIIMRALKKEKAERYQSAAALSRDLERYLAGDPVEARSGSGWYLLRKAVSVNRKRLLLAAVAGVVLVGSGVAVIASLASAAESAKQALHQQQEARAESVRARAVTELLRETLPNADPARPELTQIVNVGLGRLYFRLETGAFAEDREVDQALRRLWGSIYTGLGGGKAAALVEYAEASLRTGLVRLRIEHPGQDHKDIAATMHELAGVLLMRGRLPESESYCRHALEMRERLLGANQPTTAESHALLARVLLAEGRPADAEQEADRTLSLVRNLPDREADLPIASMTALKARVLLGRGKPSEAEPLVREAFLRRLRRLPPEDPELLSTFGEAADFAAACPDCDLSRLLARSWGCSVGDLPAALKSDAVLLAQADATWSTFATQSNRPEPLMRLLKLQEELLGPDDMALVNTLTSLMQTLMSDPRLMLRADSAIRAASILEKHFGPDDSSVMVCIEEAAVVLAFAGEMDRAIDLEKRATRIREMTPFEARDPLTMGLGARYLAWHLAMGKRCAEAVPVYEGAIEVLRKEFGEDYHLVALCSGELGFCLAETGNLSRADEATAKAMEIAGRIRTVHGDQIAHIRLSRAHVLVKPANELQANGKIEEARGFRVKALALAEQAWTPVYAECGARFPWQRVLIDDAISAAASISDQAALDAWTQRLKASEAELQTLRASAR